MRSKQKVWVVLLSVEYNSLQQLLSLNEETALAQVAEVRSMMLMVQDSSYSRRLLIELPQFSLCASPHPAQGWEP